MGSSRDSARSTAWSSGGPRWGEVPDEGLVAAHERMLAPILHRRGDYAEVRDFLLYDMLGDDGDVREDVFAYSNGRGPSRSLVVYHNKYADTSGWIRASTAFAVKDADGSKHLEQRTLADGLGLSEDRGALAAIPRCARRSRVPARCGATSATVDCTSRCTPTRRCVFGEFRELADPAGVWRRLADRLGERGVPSLDEALLEETLAPVHAAIRALAADPALDGLVRSGRPPSADELMDPVRHLVATIRTATGTSGDVDAVVEVVATRLVRIGSHAPASVHGGAASDDVDGHEPPDGAALPARATGDPILAVTSAFADPWHRAVLVAWSILEPLGRLAPDAMVGPTSRAWFDELRLGTVLATSLRDRGLDEAQAWAASDRIRMLMTLARPSNVTGRSAADRARAVTDAWLLEGASQRVLGVNTYEGVRWFAREGWRELIDWALLLDLVAAPEDAKTSAAVAAKQLAAGDASGYRVDDLLTALGGTPTGARGGAASGRGAKPAPTPAAGRRTDETSPIGGARRRDERGAAASTTRRGHPSAPERSRRLRARPSGPSGGIVAQDGTPEQREWRHPMGQRLLEMGPVAKPRRLAVAADDPRRRHRVASGAGRLRRPSTRLVLQVPHPARAHEVRRQLGRRQAGAVVLGARLRLLLEGALDHEPDRVLGGQALRVDPDVDQRVGHRTQVELPVDQPQRAVVAGEPEVHQHLRDVDRPALGREPRPEDRSDERVHPVGIDAVEVVAGDRLVDRRAAAAAGHCSRAGSSPPAPASSPRSPG